LRCHAPEIRAAVPAASAWEASPPVVGELSVSFVASFLSSAQTRHGSRKARDRIRFATSSLVNSRFAGSQLSILPRWYAMNATWQTMCEFAAAAALARVTRLDRTEQVFHVRCQRKICRRRGTQHTCLGGNSGAKRHVAMSLVIAGRFFERQPRAQSGTFWRTLRAVYGTRNDLAIARLLNRLEQA
jgi:hypothetical protein